MIDKPNQQILPKLWRKNKKYFKIHDIISYDLAFSSERNNLKFFDSELVCPNDEDNLIVYDGDFACPNKENKLKFYDVHIKMTSESDINTNIPHCRNSSNSVNSPERNRDHRSSSVIRSDKVKLSLNKKNLNLLDDKTTMIARQPHTPNRSQLGSTRSQSGSSRSHTTTRPGSFMIWFTTSLIIAIKLISIAPQTVQAATNPQPGEFSLLN